MYDDSLKYKWDNQNVLDYKVKEAVIETEKKTKYKIAREMVKDGMPSAQISKFTGLSIQEIKNLFTYYFLLITSSDSFNFFVI